MRARAAALAGGLSLAIVACASDPSPDPTPGPNDPGAGQPAGHGCLTPNGSEGSCSDAGTDAGPRADAGASD